jgi:SAM-dependent methyltransferase
MYRTIRLLLPVSLGLLLVAPPAAAQQPPTQPPPAQTPPAKPFEPYSGQPGKDVVWVPTSPALLEKMLDMAQVTRDDFVVDLGSGDGRNVIGAAKRGARGVGFEYNPDMVALSRRLAQEAGVANRATFVEGDMYQADFSKATVLALFLLPSNLEKLRDKFLALKPGTRIVMNTFAIPEWDADVTETITDDCTSWCTSLLYFVPAKVAGTWRLPSGELILRQTYQKVSGELVRNGASQTITDAQLRGEQLTFKLGDVEYKGRVNGDRIELAAGSEKWTATRRD